MVNKNISADWGATLLIAGSTLATLGWTFIMQPTINGDHTPHFLGTLMILVSSWLFFMRQRKVNGDVVEATRQVLENGVKKKD